MIFQQTNSRQAEQDEFAARMQREIEAQRSPESRDTWGHQAALEFACELESACTCGPTDADKLGCLWVYRLKRTA